MAEMFSVRMRAAQGGPHEKGGRHISGAERLIDEPKMQSVVASMLTRALTHSRGKADFINIAVEEIPEEKIEHIDLLPIMTIAAKDAAEGRKKAIEVLQQAGVTEFAARQAMQRLRELPQSLRGAMLIDAQSGNRVDELGDRGVRVSRMDLSVTGEKKLRRALAERGLDNDHVREAVVLASKVVHTPGVIAELCWSDDPEYTAGYVATRTGYFRFPHLKPAGSLIGGRAFFLSGQVDSAACIQTLQTHAVLEEPALQWQIG